MLAAFACRVHGFMVPDVRCFLVLGFRISDVGLGVSGIGVRGLGFRGFGVRGLGVQGFTV